jgi:DNA-binding beta-propeller fold protein YncE
VSYNVATHQPIAVYSNAPDPPNFGHPSGIAIDPLNGHVLVADTDHNRIVELTDSAGVVIGSSAKNYTGSFVAPNGVTADSFGRIYVADSSNSAVDVLAPDGTQIASFTSPSGFNTPENVAVNPNPAGTGGESNLLYVADTYNSRVQVFHSYGPFQPTLASTPSASVPAGGVISDAAMVSSGSSPGAGSANPADGTVSFSLYGPFASGPPFTCNGTTLAATYANVTSSSTTVTTASYSSPSFTTSQAGTFQWIVAYNGNSLNSPTSGQCNDGSEQVVVQ